MLKYTLLINSISVPIQLGLYENDVLIKSYMIEGQTSEALVKYTQEILELYTISKIIYANGPGSYMAIKLTYIMLSSIEKLRGIPFDGVSAFELNNSMPIKAMGKLYFTKEKETIITQKFDDAIKQEFWLPDNLSAISIDDENRPNYILPAV